MIYYVKVCKEEYEHIFESLEETRRSIFINDTIYINENEYNTFNNSWFNKENIVELREATIGEKEWLLECREKGKFVTRKKETYEIY